MTRKITKKSVDTFRKEAKAITDRIAADRDKLRDLLEDYQQIYESVDEAVQRLEEAADLLSQHL